jgi:hypothetical protein
MASMGRNRNQSSALSELIFILATEGLSQEYDFNTTVGRAACHVEFAVEQRMRQKALTGLTGRRAFRMSKALTDR